MDKKKRSSVALDSDVKTVFDWSMELLNSRTTSEHVQKLLEKTHGEKWADLLTKAQNSRLVCEKHNLPFVTICKDCNVSMCPKCDVGAHIALGHEVQRFCRKHQMAYKSTCLMCEAEKWTDVVDIPFIKASGLKSKLDSGSEKIVIIDTRGDSEWGEGHFPGAVHIKWSDFRYERSDGYKELNEVVEANEDKQFVLVSQGYQQKKVDDVKGSARGFLAAAELKMFHGVDDVVVLDGGWTAFHGKYPEIVEGHRQNGNCRICEYYKR